MTRTALIVGAGIGGLSAGIALRQAGWRIRIFERAATPRELGFGLGLAPNAMAALSALHVADVVRGRGFPLTSVRGELRRMNGTILKRAHVPLREALGGEMVIALRPALHGALLDAVGADAVTVGTEATGFTMHPDGVTLQLAGGQAVTGDLLVGADGVGSTIRRTLHPSEGSPRSSGLVAVRGAVHGAHHHLGNLAAVYYLGRGVESMLVRASATGIYWFLSLARTLLPQGMNDPAAVLAFMSPQFDSTFRAVTSATDDLRFDELVDRDPIPFWGKDAVTLLGDAAHPMLPQTGQGAAQAIVDAVTLGEAVDNRTDIRGALRLYEQERLRKTAALVRQGRRTARVMRATDPITCGLRELAIRLIPVQPTVKLLTRINRPG